MDHTRPYRYLLVTPGSDDFINVRKLIIEALREIGLEPVLWDAVVESGATHFESVQRAIQEADLVIADLTHNNPNVMFEVGFAQASGKQVLFIVQEEAEHIPFDIRGNLFIVYDPSKPQELSHNVKAWANFYLTQGNYAHGKA
jgi:predicted nucleotide-binding protein